MREVVDRIFDSIGKPFLDFIRNSVEWDIRGS